MLPHLDVPRMQAPQGLPTPQRGKPLQRAKHDCSRHCPIGRLEAMHGLVRARTPTVAGAVRLIARGLPPANETTEGKGQGVEWYYWRTSGENSAIINFHMCISASIEGTVSELQCTTSHVRSQHTSGSSVHRASASSERRTVSMLATTTDCDPKLSCPPHPKDARHRVNIDFRDRQSDPLWVLSGVGFLSGYNSVVGRTEVVVLVDGTSQHGTLLYWVLAVMIEERSGIDEEVSEDGLGTSICLREVSEEARWLPRSAVKPASVTRRAAAALVMSLCVRIRVPVRPQRIW